MFTQVRSINPVLFSLLVPVVNLVQPSLHRDVCVCVRIMFCCVMILMYPR